MNTFPSWPADRMILGSKGWGSSTNTSASWPWEYYPHELFVDLNTLSLFLRQTNVVQPYFEDVKQLPRVGVPHFEEMVVHRRDDCVVVAIPCYHRDFGFEVALLFSQSFGAERNNTNVTTGLFTLGRVLFFSFFFRPRRRHKLFTDLINYCKSNLQRI